MQDNTTKSAPLSGNVPENYKFFEPQPKTLAGLSAGRNKFLAHEAALIWCGVPEQEVLELRPGPTVTGMHLNESVSYDFDLAAADAIYLIDKYGVRVEFDQALGVIASAAIEKMLDGDNQQVARAPFVEFVRKYYPETIVGGPDTNSRGIEALLAENKALKAELEKARAVKQKPETEGKTVSTSNEDLRLIGALKCAALGELDDYDLSAQGKLIDAIMSHFGDYRGLGKRSMEKKFAQANKLFEVSQK